MTAEKNIRGRLENAARLTAQVAGQLSLALQRGRAGRGLLLEGARQLEEAAATLRAAAGEDGQ